MWKAIISPNPKERYTQLTPFLDSLSTLHKKTKIAIFLASGGRFAGGFFDKDVCVRHQTWHRYVSSCEYKETKFSFDVVTSNIY